MLRHLSIWLQRHLWPATSLWRAAKLGDLEMIRKLVADGAEVNQKMQTLNVEGDTPLHFAASNDQVDAVRLLLKLGAKPDARANRGGTPLMQAAFERASIETMQALVSGGGESE